MSNLPSPPRKIDPARAHGSAPENTSGAMPNPSSTDDGVERREPLYRLEERLLREERNVAAALLRRSRLLAEISVRRKGDSSRAASNRSALQNLEKALWAAWENVLQPEEGSRSKHWHQLLAQCNNLGYILGEQKDVRSGKPWILRPGAPSRAVTFPGPTDGLRAEIAIYWAAAANSAARTSPVRTSDNVVELIKALNQLGAGLAWERDLVIHVPRRSPDLDFEQKTVHTGQSPLTLALLLATALARPGIAKFSGSGSLNMLALKPWQQFLPRLGARLHQLNPHAPGLPVRLESNGNPESAHIDGETPAELILALLVAAPFYPRGLRLTWDGSDMPDGPGGIRAKLKAITEMYDLYGVPYSLQSDAITISRALPRLPGGAPDASSGPHPVFNVPLDPALNAMLLIWSRFTGWAMRLEGRWPKGDPITTPLLALLRSCGLIVTIDPQMIRGEAGPWPAEPVLDIQGHSQALPMAVVLALGAPATAMLKGLPSEYDPDVIGALANWSGRTWRQEGSSLIFQPMPRGTERSDPHFAPPDAAWAMAATMLAFKHPGIQFTGPGELTGAWPGFWTLYNHVLTASPKRTERRPEHAANNPSRPADRSAPSDSGSQGGHLPNVAQRPAPVHKSVKRRVKL
jgi:3-phosphoshikimate 1-carboxyvinyltransferase